VSNKQIDLKVVVVDDADFHRNQVISILEDNKITVAGQASTAEEGLALSATTEANVFIIDLVMPERSGLELSKILADKSSGLYIIMMSSVNIESIIIESISSGSIDFLPKPFSAADLLRSLKKIHQELQRE
jgi:two-component system chemotaxis response regulator CheY